jgi:hypothetical protein
LTRSPRAVPWENATPVGQRHDKQNCRRRRPRSRICLRQGCGRRYQPRRWNQRYCQDAECLRQVRRWQAAKRQARRRQDEAVKAEHARAQRARRQRAASSPQPLSATPLPQRVVTQQEVFDHTLCDRPGCHEAPPKRGRNQARYCCAACRQALRRVLDRERKWRIRGTFRSRRLRAQEYQAAHKRGGARQPDTTSTTPSRPPPQ